MNLEVQNKTGCAYLLGRAIILFNIVTFCYLYVITECLSVFHLISKVNIRITWAIFLLVFCSVLFISRQKIKETIYGLRAEINEIRLYIFVIIVLALAAFIFAFFIAPCNYDSMTYHLPRVMHWIQNRSVDYYFTNINRQLYSQPLAEYSVMHTYLLIGNDQCVNLVQWYAYFFSAVLIFLILKKCSVNSKIACVASIVVMTAPIIIAESVTTQNDLFAGIWPLMYLYFALDFVGNENIPFDKKTKISLLAMGCVAGLGYLSKAQGAIPIAVISLWILIARIKNRDKVLYIFLEVVVIIGVAALIALPYFVRNYYSVGDILAASEFSFLSVKTLDPRGIFINWYKNWCMGAKSYTCLPIDRLLYYSGLFLAWILRFPLEDSSITYAAGTFTNWHAQFENLPEYQMDTAAAPIICWLFLFSVGISLIKKNKNNKYMWIKRVLFLSIAIVMCYIKWQPWITRLLVPVYMLMVIYSALVMEEFIDSYNRSLIYTKVLPVIMIFFALPALHNNTLLFSDEVIKHGGLRNMFEYKQGYEEYSDLMFHILGNPVGDIGLIMDGNGYEYPLWTVLKRHDNRIEHINLKADEYEYYPDILIKIECGDNQLGDIISLGCEEYQCTYLGLDNSQYSLWEMMK